MFSPFTAKLKLQFLVSVPYCDSTKEGEGLSVHISDNTVQAGTVLVIFIVINHSQVLRVLSSLHALSER